MRSVHILTRSERTCELLNGLLWVHKFNKYVGEITLLTYTNECYLLGSHLDYLIAHSPRPTRDTCRVDKCRYIISIPLSLSVRLVASSHLIDRILNTSLCFLIETDVFSGQYKQEKHTPPHPRCTNAYRF